ncbi:Glyoxalase/Bleomycin resistance protein/Dihydroxybiphenyl dioxygenase [Aspergillus venezuelensis]
MSNSQSTSPSPFELGAFLPGGHNTDPALPENSPTAGFKLNHFMLRIRDPKRSLRFYIDLMGMRTVFTMNCGPWTIYYLGYPDTPEDRSNIPAWSAKVADPRTLTQTLGLLELYHVHGSEKPEAEGGVEISTGNAPPNLGFGHLGFTVPDVPATLERLRKEGVSVIKELGVTDRKSIPLSEWEEGRGVGVGEIHPNYATVFDQIAFVADPDGYTVELVPQAMN